MKQQQKIIYANVYRNTINDGDSQTSLLPIFSDGGGTSVHRLIRECTIKFNENHRLTTNGIILYFDNFFREVNFSRWVGGLCLSLWKFRRGVCVRRGGGGYQFLTKLKGKIQGGRGVLKWNSVCGGVWIFSGTTQYQPRRTKEYITTDSIIGNTVVPRLSGFLDFFSGPNLVMNTY